MTEEEENDGSSKPPPLTRLHNALERVFPECKDQTKGGSFTAHMTLSHFENLDDALAAKRIIQCDYEESLKKSLLKFDLDRIYVLRRSGDNGQFLRIADVGLGANSRVERWDPPTPFPAMPSREEEWVLEERMKLKARRNKSWRNGGKNRRRSNSRRPRSPPRVPDTPEVIAAKRAERKAKREQLEREQRERLKQEHQSSNANSGEVEL